MLKAQLNNFISDIAPLYYNAEKFMHLRNTAAALAIGDTAFLVANIVVTIVEGIKMLSMLATAPILVKIAITIYELYQLWMLVENGITVLNEYVD
jgi:hypothetical protein